ncbi:CaiB/BaiF CoA-transferase family protein [Phenylobacterium sp.]|uniref:CaiB/BaiF CoA-transferase family protein n=1 Tax=Phenylobacterium sp. TaxID=1871053 RepID=UPI002DE4715D|nr:CoA transferase [Phenylobacterium sp.]
MSAAEQGDILTTAARPLQGLRILEASGDVAVRYCGRLFAQLGAEVAGAGGRDDGRIGYAGELGEAYGRWLDAGKRALGDDEGWSGFDLVIAGQDRADVAAAEARLAEAAEPPALLALTWFAAQGPYAAWHGTDEIILALVGLAFGFGLAEGPPMLAQGHGPQLAGGLVGFNAAVAALLAPRGERPRRIAVSIHEASMCFTETGAITAFVEGLSSWRMGVNRFAPTYPCNSYRTLDGWVGITALIPAQWRAVCELIGRPELARDPRFATTVERLMLADEVDEILAPAYATRTTEAWVKAGEAARIPTAPMPRPGELPGVPHWRERGAFAAFDETGALGPTLPFRMAFDGAARPFRDGRAAAPLAGLKVVDFSMGWAGPLCARTLGDLGADVIKIESETHPDWWRGWEANVTSDPPTTETRYNFIAVNRNKRGVALDLTTPDGLAKAKALVAGADVVVENFAAGVLEKLGLGLAEQRRIRPGLISVSMPAFGNGGPLSGLRAYGSTVEQASGLPFLNGEADWAPCLQHVAYGDPLAGLYAAAAILAALYGRGRLGGAEIDLAQVACLFQFGADGIIAEQIVGEPLPRTGHRRARAAPVCVVAAAGEEAWLAVAVDSRRAWRGLCAALGRPEWAQDPQFDTVAGRARYADRIEAAIGDWAAGRDPREAAAQLQRLGVAAAPVLRGSDLSWDEQLIAGGFWDWMERRYVGRHLMPAAPWTYDGARPALRLPAPVLGEHTGELLGAMHVDVRA